MEKAVRFRVENGYSCKFGPPKSSLLTRSYSRKFFSGKAEQLQGMRPQSHTRSSDPTALFTVLPPSIKSARRTSSTHEAPGASLLNLNRRKAPRPEGGRRPIVQASRPPPLLCLSVRSEVRDETEASADTWEKGHCRQQTSKLICSGIRNS